MDIAIIISVLAVATCLVSIGLLVYTASLSRNRMSELVNTKRKLGQLSIENETVARLAELKQNFISVASHELRTPLFSVTGYAELLARTDLNKEQASNSESHSLSLTVQNPSLDGADSAQVFHYAPRRHRIPMSEFFGS
ncbi:hypothetical protein PSHT_15613 [Puccinia striiformis]|uniref:Signal transduction histidine kinase dimerisation/phosphoacceptor domain-containing protein n=1 Tax=Puccinia striiformis TaxID=27350 RepID=A0A2S4UDY4_9BASI|nr:hypothetical protein PSHT_15613 [Puccinia striiformis]